MLPSPLPTLPCSGVPLSGASPARPGGRTAESTGILHSWSLPQPLAPLMLAPLEALEAVRWGGSGKDDAKGRGEGGGSASSGWPAPTPLASALQQLQAWASATAAAAAEADAGSGARPASGAEGLSATTEACERAGKEGGVHSDGSDSSKAPAASGFTRLPAVSPQHALERSEGTSAGAGGSAGLATGSCSSGLDARQGGGGCPTDRAEHGGIAPHHRQAQRQGMPGAAAAGLPEPHASGGGEGFRAQGHGIQGAVSPGSPRVRAQAAVRSECASLLVQAAEQRSQCVQQALQAVGRALEADRCVVS